MSWIAGESGIENGLDPRMPCEMTRDFGRRLRNASASGLAEMRSLSGQRKFRGEKVMQPRSASFSAKAFSLSAASPAGEAP